MTLFLDLTYRYENLSHSDKQGKKYGGGLCFETKKEAMVDFLNKNK